MSIERVKYVKGAGLLKLPNHLEAIGPTAQGKSYAIFNLLANADKYFADPPKRIVVYYTHFQPQLYNMLKEEAAKFDCEVLFSPYEPFTETVLEEISLPNKQVIAYFDDAGLEACSDPRMAAISTWCRHSGVSLWVNLHKVFPDNKNARLFGEQVAYFLITKGSRIASKIPLLANQLGLKKTLPHAYEAMCSGAAYGHVFVDLAPGTERALQVRTNILSDPPRYYV